MPMAVGDDAGNGSSGGGKSMALEKIHLTGEEMIVQCNHEISPVGTTNLGAFCPTSVLRNICEYCNFTEQQRRVYLHNTDRQF